jgi:hypothetical protein
MTKSKVYLSSTQRDTEPDKGLVESIIKILEGEGLQVVQSKDLGGLIISRAIQEDILDCSLVVSVFSVRFESRDVVTNESEYMPPAMVIAETSYALGINRPVLCLLDRSMRHESTACPHFEGRAVIEFDISELDFKDKLSKAIQVYLSKAPTSTIVGRDIRQLDFRRTVWVGPDRVDVGNRVQARIVDPSRFYGFGQSVRYRASKDIEPSLQSLLAGTTRQQQFLKAKINGLDARIEPDKAEADRLYFKVGLPPGRSKPNVGEIVTYDYGWGLPRSLWPVNDLGHPVVVFESRHGEIERLEFEVMFPSGTSFKLGGKPNCRWVGKIGADWTTLSLTEPVFVEPDCSSSLHDCYRWTFRPFDGTAAIEWSDE